MSDPKAISACSHSWSRPFETAVCRCGYTFLQWKEQAKIPPPVADDECRD